MFDDDEAPPRRGVPGSHCPHKFCPSCIKEDPPEPLAIVSLWWYTCCGCNFRNMAFTFHRSDTKVTLCENPGPPPRKPRLKLIIPLPRPEEEKKGPKKISEPVVKAVVSHSSAIPSSLAPPQQCFITAALLQLMSPMDDRAKRRPSASRPVKLTKSRPRRQTYPFRAASHNMKTKKDAPAPTPAPVPRIRLQPSASHETPRTLQKKRPEGALEKARALAGRPPSSVFSRLSQASSDWLGAALCKHQCHDCLPCESHLEDEKCWYFCCRCHHWHRMSPTRRRSNAQ